MLNRRGFLWLFGASAGSTALGLWLPETGVVSLSGRMVVEVTGTCSFCSEVPPAIRALAGVVGRAQRICNRCVDLAADIARDESEPTQEIDSAPCRRFAELEAADRDRVLDAVDRMRGELKAQERLSADPDVQAALARLRRTSTLMVTTPEAELGDLPAVHADAQREVASVLGWTTSPLVRDRPLESLEADWSPPSTCSFCDATESETERLMVDRRSAVCDRCVAEAAGLMSAHGRA